jgi:hypothetical protein
VKKAKLSTLFFGGVIPLARKREIFLGDFFQFAHLGFFLTQTFLRQSVFAFLPFKHKNENAR